MPADTLLDDLLREFPVRIGLPVAWGDMDAFQHINNTVFFRYFESARVAYLDAIGFRETVGGVGPILASTRCRFRAPLIYPDAIGIGARTTEVAGDRFTMEYRVASTKLGRTAAEGGGVVVAFDYRDRAKAPLPDIVRRAIETIEGREFASW